MESQREVEKLNERDKKVAELQEKALQQAFREAYESDAQRTKRILTAREKYQKVVANENARIRKQVERSYDRQAIQQARREKIARDKVCCLCSWMSGCTIEALFLITRV